MNKKTERQTSVEAELDRILYPRGTPKESEILKQPKPPTQQSMFREERSWPSPIDPYDRGDR